MWVVSPYSLVLARRRVVIEQLSFLHDKDPGMILAPSLDTAGPNTLEELFAARYARGDMDRLQYLTQMDRLALRFNRIRSNIDRTTT